MLVSISSLSESGHGPGGCRIHGSLSGGAYPLSNLIGSSRHVQSQFAYGSRRDARRHDRKGGAHHHRAGAGVLGADPFLGLQPGKTLVAQARTGHRPLLLVLRSVVRAGVADRAVGARRRRGLQHSRRRRTDRVLRQWPWSAVRAAAVVAGPAVPGVVGLHAVLAAPAVSRRRILEISRHSPFLGRAGLDFGGA